MEGLPLEALNRVTEFLGEPDDRPKAPPIGPVFRQLYSICYCCRALAAWYKHWYDWEMLLRFHH